MSPDKSFEVVDDDIASCEYVKEYCDDRTSQSDPASSPPHPDSGSHPMRPFPIVEAESFSCVSTWAEGPIRRVYVPLPAPAPAPKPVIVKTDRTRCLIRALRSRADGGMLLPVAIRSSVSPSVRQLQTIVQKRHMDQQRHQYQEHSEKRVQDDPERVRRRPETEPRPPQRTSHRQMKLARREARWESMTRERRLACLWIGVMAATTHKATENLGKLLKNLKDDLNGAASPNSIVLREIAESVFSWKVSDLTDYLTEAGIGLGGQKIDLACRVYAHLRPQSE